MIHDGYIEHPRLEDLYKSRIRWLSFLHPLGPPHSSIFENSHFHPRHLSLFVVHPPEVNMFSFMKIATFAALAFGTFASAIPAPAPAPALEAGALEARTGTTVTEILAQLAIDVKDPCSKLSACFQSFAPCL